MKSLANNNSEQFDVDILSEHSSHVFVDGVLSHLYDKHTTLHLGIPAIGAHLVSPRTGYTHHGLYCGLDNNNVPFVIHYAGFSEAFKSAPVEIISLEEFAAGKGFHVQSHARREFSVEESIERAKSRLGEDSYGLVFNNCEHFVNWCIEGVSVSRQVAGASKVAAKVGLKVASKANVASALAVEAAHLSSAFKAYITGDISKEKLMYEVSHSAVTCTSMAWYGTLGQAAVPIPGVGFFIGASVGYFVGNMLHQSGHVALGETPAVREARERRAQINHICSTLLSETKAHRVQLEKYLSEHFGNREKVFIDSFNMLESALSNSNSAGFIEALDAINSQFGESLQFKTFEDFDRFMESDEAFDF